jgi:hypothetical protein
MADEKINATGIAAHGASRLPSADIDSFNIELKDEEGVLGDRASKGAFKEILEKWRKPLLLSATGEGQPGRRSAAPQWRTRFALRSDRAEERFNHA